MRRNTLPLFLALAALVGSDCTCGDTLGLAIGEIELALCDRGEVCGCQILTPESKEIEFGSPPAGDVSRRTLTINNLNKPRKLTISAISIQGSGDLFSVTRIERRASAAVDAEVESHDMADGPLVLEDDAFAEVFLAFEPSAAGEFSATLVITSTSASSPTWQVNLHGGGGTSSACVPEGTCGTGGEIDFGTFNDTELGFDNATGLPKALGTLPITVHNDSNRELYFTVGLTNDGIPEGPGEVPGERGVFFVPATALCTIVPPQSTFDVAVEYRPSFAGEHLGEAILKGLGDPIRVSLHGRVIGAHVCFHTEDDAPDDSLLQFGDPPLYDTASNATPETRRIFIENCGFQQDLTITAAQLRPATSADFRSTALPWTLTAPITPGNRIEMPVTLTPTSGLATFLTGAVRFDSNDRRTPTAWIELAGRIGPPEVCVLTASPSPVDFGWVAADDAAQGNPMVRVISRFKDVTFVNVGQRTCTDVTVGPITPSQAEPGMFSIYPPPGTIAPFTLGPNQASAPVTLLFVDDPRETPELFAATLAFDSPDSLVSGQSVILKVKAGGSPACAIAYSPVSPPTMFCPSDSLAFGNVNFGQDKTIPLQVKNVGSEACEVQNVRKLSGTSNAFNFSTAPFNIPVGNSYILDVTFTAPLPSGDPFEEIPFMCGSNGMLLDYRSVSTNWATSTLYFSGKGKPPSIDVIPGEIDFGEVTVGCCSARHRVAIYNNGTINLNLSSVTVVGGAASDFSVGLPSGMTIPPGGSVEFYAQYCASAEGPASDMIAITGQDANGNAESYSVSVTGTGVLSSEAEDRYQQPARPMVDVLFAVDDSGSMGEEQDELAQNFDSFIHGALDLNTDYHIGVTNTDGETEWSGRLHSCYANKFITDVQPDAEQEAQFRCNVNVSDPADNRPSTDNKESPLQAARAAFEYPTAEWNTGFYREEAKLYIIAVQDEVEQSDGEAALYVDYFRNLKGIGNPDLLNISAIAGPPPDGCASAEGNQKLYDVTQLVGGQFRSICTADWSDLLDSLGLDVFNARRQFPLDRPATAATITVRVCPGACPANANTCPIVPQNATNGWTFDASVNAVTFNGTSVPQAGQCISVTYTAMCYSEGQG